MIQKIVLGALNHLLQQADWARSRLQVFAGKRASIAMPPWQLDFVVNQQGCFEPAAADQPVDVTVQLPANGPLLMLQGMSALMAKAHVVGNAEFATALSEVLKNLRWDAEEDFSRVVGDIGAHRLVMGAKSMLAWQKQFGQRAAENLAEYFSEEKAWLCPSRELAAFQAELAELEQQISRAEQRLAQLGHK